MRWKTTKKYTAPNQELKPVSRVETDNGPMHAVAEEVSAECLWWEIYGEKDLLHLSTYHGEKVKKAWKQFCTAIHAYLVGASD